MKAPWEERTIVAARDVGGGDRVTGGARERERLEDRAERLGHQRRVEAAGGLLVGAVSEVSGPQ